MVGRTRATLGDISSAVTSLTANAEAQAESEALSYASDLYDQYQTQIWLAGLTLVSWIIWVSTRDTCSKCHAAKS